MTMLKRAMIIVLGIVFGAGMLLAGGKKEDTTETSETTVEDATREIPEYMGLPIVEETYTLKLMRYKHPYNIPLNEMTMFVSLEKDTNVHIEWEDVIDSAWDERLGLGLASGDIPDGIFGSGDGISDFQVLSYKHNFLPLEDLIYEYAPNIVEMFIKRPDAKAQSIAEDGNIYSLPQVYEIFSSATMPCISINTDWLDRVELDMPTTTEEYYQVLKAFKEQDANGNGDPDDEIPFTFRSLTNDWASANSFWGAFGVIPFTQPMHITDGKLEYPYTHPGFKEGIKYFNRLYSEGLLDQEVFTQDVNQYIAILAADPPIVGVSSAWTLASINPATRSQVDYLPVLKGPDGHQLYARTTPATINRHFFLLNVNIEKPDIAMRWVNECYSEDMSIQLMFGGYGDMIEKQSDGTIKFLDPPEGINQSTWMWTNAIVDDSPIALYKEIESRLELTQLQIDKNEANDVYAPYLPDEVYPNIFYSQEVLDEINLLLTDIDAYIMKQTVDWIANGGIDEEWDAYLDQLDKMNVDRLIELYTIAYNQYKSQ